jgi:hypothetical protein
VGFSLGAGFFSESIVVYVACGEPKPAIEAEIKGSAIGEVTSPRNEMIPEVVLKFQGDKGKQTPDKFKGKSDRSLEVVYWGEAGTQKGNSEKVGVTVELKAPLEQGKLEIRTEG